MYEFNQVEYEQSLSVLEAITKESAKQTGMHVVVRSTLSVDNDFTYCAYSRHLLLSPIGERSFFTDLMNSARRCKKCVTSA